MKFAVALLALFAAANAASVKKVGEFSWTNLNPDDPIQIENLEIAPDPVLIPGEVTFSITISGTVAVVSPTAGTITLEFRADADSDYIEVPCVDGFGSCNYDDVCDLLLLLFPAECPPAFTDNDVPCHCPFEAKEYTINDGVLEFVDPLETVLAGDYRLTSVLSQNGAELQNYQFTLSIQPAPEK